jgi:hypothetical protein
VQEYADVTLIFGPAGPEDLKEKVERWASNEEKTTDEFWYELLIGALEKSGESSIDEIFSSILETSVRVQKVFLTYEARLNDEGDLVKYAALMLYPERFTDIDGAALEITVAAEHVTAAASVISRILKTEWVQVDTVRRDEMG